LRRHGKYVNHLLTFMLGTLKTLLAGKEDVAVNKPAMPLAQLEPGSAIQFSNTTLIPELRGKKATIQSVRTYRFTDTSTVSYMLSIDVVDSLILTIAQDEEGYYLGISRELDADQQHLWFDRDALSFFTEPSSAKTLKARVTDAQFPGWVSPKYVKAIEFMQGALTQGRLSTSDAARKTQAIQYSLLVNDVGDKAIEIEVYPELKTHRIYVTVYRPADDIIQVSQPIPHIPVPEAKPKNQVSPPKPIAAPEAVAVIMPAAPVALNGAHSATAKPAETVVPNRTDFRRLNMADHAPVIGRPAAPVKMVDDELEQAAPVPKFLTQPASSKEVTRSKYLTLDEVLPPEIERVRCDISTAKLLIDESIKRGVRVRDLLRHMTGLQTPAHDEVLFEMPLSDADYKQLAQRYQVKPDMHAEIRSRMMDELQKKLKKING
jgi:hypothetical protein